MLSQALSEGFLIRHLSLLASTAAPVGSAHSGKKVVELRDSLCIEPFLQRKGSTAVLNFTSDVRYGMADSVTR